MNFKSTILAILIAAATTAAQADEQEFERKVPADANGAVEISNVAGTVVIVGWDRAEVEVKGVLGEGIERVDVSSEGKRTLIKVVTSRNTDEGEADLRISVPRGSEVTGTAVSSDISSKAVLGALRLTTVSGNVEAEIAGADVQVKSVSGDILLRGSQRPADLRLSTVSGNVQLERGAGDVEATSVSGDVTLEVNPAQRVRLHSTAGDLGFKGQLAEDGSLEAETLSGSVAINAGGRKGYEYEVMNFSGEIENCFGQKIERTEPYGPESRLTGRVGEGGARIRVKSMNGDVNICDK